MSRNGLLSVAIIASASVQLFGSESGLLFVPSQYSPKDEINGAAEVPIDGSWRVQRPKGNHHGGYFSVKRIDDVYEVFTVVPKVGNEEQVVEERIVTLRFWDRADGDRCWIGWCTVQLDNAVGEFDEVEKPVSRGALVVVQRHDEKLFLRIVILDEIRQELVRRGVGWRWHWSWFSNVVNCNLQELVEVTKSALGTVDMAAMADRGEKAVHVLVRFDPRSAESK